MSMDDEPCVDTYDVSLDHQIGILNAAAGLEDDSPLSRLSRERLIAVHLNNLKVLKNSSKPQEPKPLVLPAAYAPSIVSLNDLQKVR